MTIDEIKQEYDDKGALDVESETSDDIPEIERPWNPESIRVGTKSFSLRNMLDAIAENFLDLAPEFQRLRVWKPVQKAQLVESILLQIPLPAFYFAEDPDGLLRVVDGVQRLSTVHDFVRGDFSLTGLEYISDVEGLRFADLPPRWQRRLYNTQIVAHVIDPSTPAPVMYDIFRRINTGGTPLNGQEIRHCMSKPRSREFLRRLAGLTEFRRATGGRLQDHRRMVDREVALRFCAFWILGPERFLELDTMEGFLWETTQLLDDPERFEDEQRAPVEDAFRRGLANAYVVFGDHAFRKWSMSSDSLNPFNRALFESWTVELARADEAKVGAAASVIAERARHAMTSDADYLSSITAATGDRRRVTTRFVRARKIITEAIK